MTEVHTARKGVYVAKKDTVADIALILAGRLDQVQPEKLLYIGALKDTKF